MRLFLIITVIAVMAVMAGCGSARNTITLRAEPLSAVIPDKKSSDDTSIEVAPFGNAALAGKPGEEEEAVTHVWDFRDATTWLLGEISPSRFFDTPYSSWYVSGYRDYSPDPVIMEQLKEIDIDDYTVTIVLGTWCSDSRREVPRFMKIIDQWGFPEDKISFIGVDINKAAPLADFKEYGIERVPTFIFFKNKSEKGRIIEIPVTSLEQDTRNILTEN